ncbi:hypothetical protein P7C70_g5976, partial [Phenoliferia sp. Uapishka_3]
MGIFTKRSIKKDEELTFNYNVDRYGHTAQECYCGEPNCVGFIGGKTQTDIGGMDDLYLDALGITDEVEALGLRGTKKKKGKQLDDDFIPLLKPIEFDEVPKVSAAVRQALTTKRILEKLLTRINMTEDQDVQRQLLRLHGFNLMSHILVEYPTDVSIIIQALEILKGWPLSARNKVESSKIEAPVKLCSEMEDEPKIVELSTSLLADWEELTLGYRIPRAAKDPNTSGLNKRSADISIESLSKRHRVHDTPQDSFSPEPFRPVFIKPEATVWAASTLPLPPVPPGWSVSRDERTNKIWYKNMVTMQSTRDPPTAPAIPIKSNSNATLDVNSIIAKVQAEAKVRAEKEREQKAEEERRKKDKKRAEVGASKDKRVMGLFSAIVVSTMSKYKEYLEGDQFKKRARELTTILCDKEKKHPNYHDEPYDRLSPEKAAKVKSFTKDWVKKLIQRRPSHSKSSTSASASAPATPSISGAITTPSPSTTPRLPDATPRTPFSRSEATSVGGETPLEPELELESVARGDTPPGTPPSKRTVLPPVVVTNGDVEMLDGDISRQVGQRSIE